MDRSENPAHDELAELNTKLEGALMTLEQCARIIARVRFNQELENVKVIGRAMSEIGKIQLQIWEQRPDLRPAYTEKDWGRITGS